MFKAEFKPLQTTSNFKFISFKFQTKGTPSTTTTCATGSTSCATWAPSGEALLSLLGLGGGSCAIGHEHKQTPRSHRHRIRHAVTITTYLLQTTAPPPAHPSKTLRHRQQNTAPRATSPPMPSASSSSTTRPRARSARASRCSRARPRRCRRGAGSGDGRGRLVAHAASAACCCCGGGLHMCWSAIPLFLLPRWLLSSLHSSDSLHVSAWSCQCLHNCSELLLLQRAWCVKKS